MTDAEFKNKVEVLIDQIDLDKLTNKAIISGAIDISQEPEDSFKLAKCVVITALLSSVDQIGPINKDMKEEIENLQHFI